MTQGRYTPTGAGTWSCGDCPRPTGAVITGRAGHDAWHTLTAQQQADRAPS